MAQDQEKSLGDQQSIVGGKSKSADDTGQHSLGDAETFVGSPLQTPDRSLGDEFTLGGSGSVDELVDDKIEIVDLESRYRIEKSLGQGGMGEVLLATDTRLDRKVAIKRILGDSARSRTAVNRFLTEAKSIAALNHPNVVQIYDYGRDAKGPFLIMEYVDGSSLLDRCRDGAVPLEEATELACQLCDGLGRAHDAGIVHRDIKPANVLLTRDGIPKLTDFGLAKAETADTGMTMARAVLGTIDFMPPEQRRDAALVDARSDLWSLAATLYQMVTGRSPKIVKFNDVPKALQEVLGKALEDRKEDRYQTAKELKEALRESMLAGTEVDLEVGECIQCGTKNETTRKFCKKCAKSLEVACLDCSSRIPVWEEICGQCGARQSELVEQRKRSMAEEREQAERLLENLEFEKATEITTEIGKESDIRLQQLKEWSQEFLPRIEHTSREQLENVANLLGEALKHEQAHDYSSAIHTLEQVPVIFRQRPVECLQGITAEKLTKLIQDKLDEARQLEKHIRNRVTSGQLDGLQNEVDQLLALYPKHSRMLKLRQQLLDREAKLIASRDEAFANAEVSMKAQDYEGVIRELERIAPSVMKPAIANLMKQAIGCKNRVQSLRKSIATALEMKKYHGLISDVESLLDLRRDDHEMLKLRQQLIDREAKLIDRKAKLTSTRDEAYALAKALMEGRDYQGAVTELARIDPDFMQPKIEQLKQQATENWKRLQALQESIANAVKQKKTQGLLEKIEEFLKLKPEDEEMLKLRQQLLDQEAKIAAQRKQIVQRAQKLRQDSRFQQAQQELSRIPMEQQTRQVVDLLRDCELMALKRQEAMEALSEGLSSQNYDLAISLANKYHKRIAQTAIHDEQFLSQYQACLQGNAKQQRRAKAAEKLKQSSKILTSFGKKLFILAIFTPLLATAIFGVFTLNPIAVVGSLFWLFLVCLVILPEGGSLTAGLILVWAPSVFFGILLIWQKYFSV